MRRLIVRGLMAVEDGLRWLYVKPDGSGFRVPIWLALAIAHVKVRVGRLSLRVIQMQQPEA